MVELTMRQAVVLIVAAALLVLMFPAATKIYAAVPAAAFSEAECRASVVWRAKTGVSILDIESPVPFECSTRTIYLKYDESGRKKDEFLESITPTYYISKNDEKKVKKVFSESIGKCLWQMGDGEVNAFKGDEVQLATTEEDISRWRCVICYDIIIEKDIVDPKKGNITKLSNYQNYLETQKFSKTKTFYAQYLKMQAFPDIALVDNAGNPVSYSVLFSFSKASKSEAAALSAKVTAGASIGVGCALGAVIGFFGGGPFGAAGGCIIGASIGAKVAVIPTTIAAIIGYTLSGDGVWMLGLQSLNNVSSQCQGLF
jgi:hypothetical protein